ncbi:MAG TPA: CoA ester lyase [Acidimicrobiales bacterium]|nr:CoA ester lyase [Acidimicrobiales bacterium]
MRFKSLLFVPANREDLVAKAHRSQPDAVVLDLEDAVPAAEKAAARAGLAESIATVVGHGIDALVRVNAPGSAWLADDLAALPGNGVAAVVVPKLETPDAARAVARRTGGLPLVAGLETVRGVLDARAVLAHPVAACYFGAEDYVADLGGARTPGNLEVLTARSLVAMAARLAGIAAYDMVVLDVTDASRFSAEAHEARSLGYAGKLCVHPAQVPLANAAFTPTEAEVSRATRLLAAFEDALAQGRATVGFEGTMVDEVVARQARAVLEAARRTRR